jgi:hypothetical protein
MTYRSRSGRQFVLVATSTGSDASLMAFALPVPGRTTPGVITGPK